MSIIINDDFLIMFRDFEEVIHECCNKGCEICQVEKLLDEVGGCSVVDIACGRSISLYTECKNGSRYIYAGWRAGGSPKKMYIGKLAAVNGRLIGCKLRGAFKPC